MVRKLGSYLQRYSPWRPEIWLDITDKRRGVNVGVVQENAVGRTHPHGDQPLPSLATAQARIIWLLLSGQVSEEESQKEVNRDISSH